MLGSYFTAASDRIRAKLVDTKREEQRGEIIEGEEKEREGLADGRKEGVARR